MVNSHDRHNAQRSPHRQQDRNEAAIVEGTTPERAQCPSAARSRPADQLRSDRLQDGYRDTEGREYEREQPAREQLEDRDPTHSGACHACNKPGTPATAPGREEGTAWSANRQTSQGQNPKNPSD